MSAAQSFIDRVTDYVLTPIMILLTTAAVALFIFGLVQLLFNANDNEARTKGKRHILWSIIGLFVIVAATAILRVVLNTFGINL